VWLVLVVARCIFDLAFFGVDDIKLACSPIFNNDDANEAFLMDLDQIDCGWCQLILFWIWRLRACQHMKIYQELMLS